MQTNLVLLQKEVLSSFRHLLCVTMGSEDQKDLEEAENKFVAFLEKFKGNEIRVG